VQIGADHAVGVAGLRPHHLRDAAGRCGHRGSPAWPLSCAPVAG
jgi:hypothetical protein